MDIGPPRRIIEIQPESLPLPDLVPNQAPTPAPPNVPAPSEPSPGEPATPEPTRPDR